MIILRPLVELRQALATLLADGCADCDVPAMFSGISVHTDAVPEEIAAPYLLVFQAEDETPLYPDIKVNDQQWWKIPVGITLTQPWSAPHPAPAGYDHSSASQYESDLCQLVAGRWEKDGTDYDQDDRSTYLVLSDILNTIAADAGLPLAVLDSRQCADGPAQVRKIDDTDSGSTEFGIYFTLTACLTPEES